MSVGGIYNIRLPIYRLYPSAVYFTHHGSVLRVSIGTQSFTQSLIHITNY